MSMLHLWPLYAMGYLMRKCKSMCIKTAQCKHVVCVCVCPLIHALGYLGTLHWGW